MEHPTLGLLLLMTLPGILTLIIGMILKSSASKYPATGMGYKTDLTRKNEQTWKEGNSFSGNVLILLGLFNIVLWPLAGYIFWDGLESMIVMSWLTFLMLTIGIPVSLTESHLNKMFDRNGNLKVS